MIFVTGDTHGDIRRLSSKVFTEQSEMTKDDYLIILGDFGLVWNQHGESAEEKYWLDWLDSKPFTTLFIDGNHENFDRLFTPRLKPWHGGKVRYIRPSVIYLSRGYVFNIQGKKFFTFGGARSHDIQDGILTPNTANFKKRKKELDERNAMYRIRGVSWWAKEMPSIMDMRLGIENLSLNNNQVDYILTHTTCNSTLAILTRTYGYNYEPDKLTNYLQTIKETVSYKHWLFGHLHINENIPSEKSVCIYEQIIQIE